MILRFFSILMMVCAGQTAYAWDQHHYLTRPTLMGLKHRDGAIWSKLTSPVTVTSIERFLERVFGADCTFERAKKAVFDDVGRNYNVLYATGVKYSTSVEWERGISRVAHTPQGGPPASNPQAVGKPVLPLEVISVYSDEPDWGMDDDVPSLEGKGVSEAHEGTATRLLRHFWYEGEEEYGVRFDADQETDRRMQLFYQLSVVAFAAGEPYWGYRFLGNALHYLQDMTQPFHTKAIITDSLINKLAVVRAYLCEKRGGKDCVDSVSISQEVIKNAWVVGAYHSAYEDFGRALLMPTARFMTANWLIDAGGAHEARGEAEALLWKTAASRPWLDLREVIRDSAEFIDKFAEDTGDLAYESFGWSMRYDVNATKAQILSTGGTDSLAYKIGTLFGFPYLYITDRQTRAVPKLVDQTHLLMLRAGVWGRHLVKQTLDSLQHPPLLAAAQQFREQLRRKCAAPSSH